MIKLNVNGKDHEIGGDVDPSTPLLWVLRDTLGLVGTKYGCGIAQCGACTVHIDGAPIALMPGAGLRCRQGTKIKTIEGLAASDGTLHALQKAWVDLDVPQCGYCQAGQLMSAAALLARTPSRQTPISMRRWPAICAAAPPISASARRSTPQPANLAARITPWPTLPAIQLTPISTISSRIAEGTPRAHGFGAQPPRLHRSSRGLQASRLPSTFPAYEAQAPRHPLSSRRMHSYRSLRTAPF